MTRDSVGQVTTAIFDGRAIKLLACDNKHGEFTKGSCKFFMQDNKINQLALKQPMPESSLSLSIYPKHINFMFWEQNNEMDQHMEQLVDFPLLGLGPQQKQ